MRAGVCRVIGKELATAR